ncbi:MAG: SH3 domain-containing protein [Chloroflexota bacterium]|nr:SH3 domain-containing protein [Chloroflexota bacterium]
MNRKLTFMTLALLVAALGVFAFGAAASPASAQPISTFWTAQYYNNPTLEGNTTLSRGESAIAFAWGLGSPDPAIPVDNFSARFATDVSLAAGTYRFFLLADDNARITFNYGYTPVIDTFITTNQVGTLQTTTLSVPAAGTFHIQIDYREVTNDAFLYMSFGNAATTTQPNFAVPTNTNVTINPGGSWVAQYYNNTSLSGDPAAILSVSSPSNDWGLNAPLPSLPVDNFSVRWTGTFALPNGNYQISLRADDGVRLFVNGVLLINQFGGATGQTYTANFTNSGSATIVIEYVEFVGNAFIDYRLTQQVTNPAPSIPVAPSGANATIAAFRLNVRETPSSSAAILTRVNQNETYPIIGRTGASTWYQINANGIIGWVAGGFIVIANGGNIAVVDGSAPSAPPAAPSAPVVSPTGVTATANPFSVNMRQGPSTTFARVGRLPAGSTAAVIGRTTANQWYQIDFNGVRGWVSAGFTRLNAGANINNVPVTG